MVHLTWRRWPQLGLHVVLDHLELALEGGLKVVLEEALLPVLYCPLQFCLEGVHGLASCRDVALLLGACKLLVNLLLAEGQALT